MEAIERFPIPERLLAGYTSNGEPTFPWKLHMVLEASEQLGFEDIISWQGENAFKVHDQKRFESQIMRRYFKKTQYRSFQRQLNIYGFHRMKVGIATGSYTHPFLVRGQSELCSFMFRTKIKMKGIRSKTKDTKRIQNIPIATCDTIDTIVMENYVNNDLKSNRDTATQLIFSNNKIGPTVVTNFSPTMPIKSALNQTPLYVVSCGESSKMDTSIVNSGKRNDTFMSFGNCNLTFDDSSQQGRIYQYKSVQELRKLLQQQHMKIKAFHRQANREALDAKKHNEETVNSHVGCFCVATCKIGTELDLDTIFDDNDNDYNHNVRNA